MRHGFIFNHDLCVCCKACSAACMLENGWDFHARNIYSFNGDAVSHYAVLNLSLACNHCFDPACMNGCPSAAYHKDSISGAVIIEPEKCLGCSYCVWNCPYDAPKFSAKAGIIEKCHYCFHRIKDELEPACSSACPTGALSFGEIGDEISLKEYSWMPEKRLNPSMKLTGSATISGPEIVPSLTINKIIAGIDIKEKSIDDEWSLIIFTFMSALSVSLNVSGLINNLISPGWWPLALILLAAASSVLHLRKKLNLWRAVINIRQSPLSREIFFLLLYLMLLCSNIFYDSILLTYISSLSGLLLLLSIDNTYTFVSKKLSVRFHSGQTFISGLLMISYLAGAMLPFAFIAAIKLIICIAAIKSNPDNYQLLPFRILRIAFLVISFMIIISGISKGTIAGLLIFMTGELIDRVMFYFDFKPENIRETINNLTIYHTDEKKRG